MKSIRTIKVLSRVFIFFSAASLLYVSALAFINPQAVMDLVQTKLPNNDAFSSIRGVYGGVGLTISLFCIVWAFTNILQGLRFLAVMWGCYALSRLITIGAEGPLGAFGTQWLYIETTFCLLALLLSFSLARASKRIPVK
ncbi:DUF4345 domain-containing protein [Paraflavitalea sp. CAU 1676]|uniref:DUF4345 domain-containing protein n=1 Tax=Paraflavitalea sp. CAU 1676 TaxID=3032598 RepID=UPI0023D9E83B|nr:DUF4345 domain-containing protein [Paraflavitalea sp. CAU 1676]MDF2190607.1 DUF4345 domain-containing protein [Paraflavitalea sp. CAU 1676]